MSLNPLFAGIALVFFTAGLACWTYSWWIRDRSLSLVAFTYACIFWGGGILMVVLWRFASD